MSSNPLQQHGNDWKIFFAAECRRRRALAETSPEEVQRRREFERAWDERFMAANSS